jgi:hypothetical protein
MLSGAGTLDAARPHEPEMSFIANGKIRLGVDLHLGGAITWLSRSGGENVVNSHDFGRQIQMAFYSGPVPFGVGDNQPASQWRHIGWNPIQSGDDFGNTSRVIEHRNDGRSIYVKTVPLQWPLRKVESECTFESWLELDGAAVRARGRLTNTRSDKTQYPARDQELPAVYLNAPFHRPVSYTGAQPFTAGKITELPTKGVIAGMWTGWTATERWSAWLNDEGWGVGIWSPSTTAMIGGFSGRPGAGGPADAPTAYVAPQRMEILDANIVYEFRYALVLGNVEQIREFAAAQPRAHKLPAWDFREDRQGWHYRNAEDAGWPIRGVLDVRMEKNDPQLISPRTFWRAEDAPRLVIEAAYDGAAGQAQIFWDKLGDVNDHRVQRVAFTPVSDGQFHEYVVNLAAIPAYEGGCTQLRFDPIPNGAPGARIRIRRIALESTPSR